MQPSPSPVSSPVFGDLTVRPAARLKLVPAVPPVAKTVLQIAAGPDRSFVATFRANLRAAARHAALGHAGTSFRECTGAACCEAANLIPELEPIRAAATDAELDAIFSEVLAALSEEGLSVPAPS